MIFMRHPEATCFSSPKDLGAPRESSAFFADEKNARLARFPINHRQQEGGESGAKLGQRRAIRAVCRTVGSDFHRLLEFSS
jgi:hypothetical protein